MTTIAICAAVFAGSLFISWKIGQFLKLMDNLDAQHQAVDEAERIAEEEFDRMWGEL